jgi:RimJ/RimL family protein N-acetyltransferase
MSDEERFIERMRDASNSLMLLAEVDGRVVGVLTFEGGQTPRIQHTGEFGISILQEYWGIGIGRQLVAALIEWARGTGIIRKINLRVHVSNLRAIRLYEGFGFKVEGRISREYNVGGQFYDNLAMGLHID